MQFNHNKRDVKFCLFLGITGQGQQSNSTQSCNPLGLGLNLNALPVNPALVAAALNQAGWGLIGSLQNQPEPNFNQGFNNPPNSSNGKFNLMGNIIVCLLGTEITNMIMKISFL